MPKIDKIKEEIGWLKLIFALLTAIDVSLIGWLAQNIDSAKKGLLLFTLSIIILITSAIIVSNRKIYKKIKQLGNL